MSEMFQSTHPQGVRQTKAGELGAAISVSIHAPAGGATLSFGRMNIVVRRFNPRTRRGCDIYNFVWQVALYSVSIHAPAGGATPWQTLLTGRASVFQSTHPQGVRHFIEGDQTF